MTSRGHGMSLKDWDPMKDDFNDSTYDAQYADDNIDCGVQLDHNRLYVSNIPQTLSEEGLKMAFIKYGTIVKLFMSRDPKKRYAMITYESPSEAKLAMMKLNKSEPLKLNVSIAHKKRNQDTDERDRGNPRANATWNRAYKDESSSVSSKGNYRRKQDTASECDDESVAEGIDSDLHLELEQLKLEHLRLQEEQLQCKQRILLLNRAGRKPNNLSTNRIVTADGKIVFKTTSDRSVDLPADTTLSGAGDSSKIPGLQRVSRRECIHCGVRAELYCAGCGITPYCGTACQRTDWNRRHKTVCHNLARFHNGAEISEANNNTPEEVDKCASVAVHRSHPTRSPRRRRDDDDTSARTDSDDARRVDKKNQTSGRGRNYSPRNCNIRRPNVPANKRSETQEESDGTPKENRSENKTPAFHNGAPNLQVVEMYAYPPPLEAHAALRSCAVRSVLDARAQLACGHARGSQPPGSAQRLDVRNTIRPNKRPNKEAKEQREKIVPDQRPESDILPKQYVAATASINDLIYLSVESMAQHCATKQRGFVCLSLPEKDETSYKILCTDYPQACEADGDVVVPKPGELFSYRNPEDGGWYRARSLDPATAALVDSSKLATVAPTDPCKRVPASYMHVPEFSCVLDADCVELGGAYEAIVTSKQTDSISVKLKGTEGFIGEGKIYRWLPEVEKVIATQPPLQKPSPVQKLKAHNARPLETEEIKREVKSVTEVAPRIDLMPKQYLVSTLSVGDTVLLSVDSLSKDCMTRQSGYVCVSLHESAEESYQLLCADFCADCDAEKNVVVPKPGELFSYRNPEDGGWYRARSLDPATAALVDSSKLATVAPTDPCKRVPEKYEGIPEFCCVLDADCVKLGESYQATIVSKQCESVQVKLRNVGSDIVVGDGTITRWLPDVHRVQAPSVPAATIPKVSRPCVTANTRVLLVDATGLDCIYVRPADSSTTNKYNAALQDALLFGRNAKPLSEPPHRGQLVIGRFADGNHYRALVLRTSVRQNKYLLEYVEYGNIEIGHLENLYPCPDEINLDQMPTVVSMVKVKSDNLTLTAQAKEYIEKLRDAEIELILTLPDGAKAAPSGSEVILTVEKNKESVNRKLVELCTPDWKKMADSGVDVVDLEPIMFNELDVVELPRGDLVLTVLDYSTLGGGVLAGCPADCKHADHVWGTLAKEIADYCNSDLGREPYLPKPEELCIARTSPTAAWSRAVLLEQGAGAGGARAQVCLVDAGGVADVPVRELRKLLPAFARAAPALASLLQIRGFPANPTPAMLRRAIEFLQIDSRGHGRLKLTNCVKTDEEVYEADAPELLAAMGS